MNITPIVDIMEDPSLIVLNNPDLPPKVGEMWGIEVPGNDKAIAVCDCTDEAIQESSDTSCATKEYLLEYLNSETEFGGCWFSVSDLLELKTVRLLSLEDIRKIEDG